MRPDIIKAERDLVETFNSLKRLIDTNEISVLSAEAGACDPVIEAAKALKSAIKAKLAHRK